ncbi:hypothetical protein GGI43DRAFT_323868 [Trichoderma evansii]
MACGILTTSIGNVAAQLCRGNWLAEEMLRLPKKQVSCRSFAQVLGSAVGTTRVVTLVHASPRIYRRPISEARDIPYKLEQRRKKQGGYHYSSGARTRLHS